MFTCGLCGQEFSHSPVTIEDKYSEPRIICRQCNTDPDYLATQLMITETTEKQIKAEYERVMGRLKSLKELIHQQRVDVAIKVGKVPFKLGDTVISKLNSNLWGKVRDYSTDLDYADIERIGMGNECASRKFFVYAENLEKIYLKED